MFIIMTNSFSAINMMQVTLSVGSKQIEAHKLILSVSSNFFKSILNRKRKRSRLEEVLEEERIF